MRKYFTKEFLDYAGERALKTAIQALVAGGLIGGGLFELNPTAILSLAGGTVVLSIATSILAYKDESAADLSGKHSL